MSSPRDQQRAVSHDNLNPSAPSVGQTQPETIEKHVEETPTASHALAEESLELHDDEATQNQPSSPKGASQESHSTATEVKDLGWKNDDHKPIPIVGGLGNEQLWTLVRRFDKQVFQVRRIKEPPLANLDMNIADDEEFSPDKLRAQLERTYLSVAVPLFAAWKHVARLRSWREWQRTSAFLSVYVVAWLLDLVVPTLIAFLMTLVLWPRSRAICFPPAPPALIDSDTGGVKKPAAGVLGSDDSVTGAPENHPGEAVEEEAHSFINSLSHLVVSTAAGKHPQGDPHDDEAVPDPTQVADTAADAKDKANGAEPSPKHKKSKQPVSNAVWTKARPVMHAIADLADSWERFSNALSPTPPFPQLRPRLTLAVVLLPMLLGSLYTTSYMVMKGMGFGMGFGFFGDPIIQRMVEFANRTYPRWQKFVELRHTILRGIPTNVQLTVTLLRIGERNGAPIPPPPLSDQPPPEKPTDIPEEQMESLHTSEDEVQAAAQPISEPQDPQLEHQEKPKKSKRILNLLKGTTKGGVQTALTADKAKAAAGRTAAINRLGAVRRSTTPMPETGPIQFPARYRGQRGHAYITTASTTPALSWTSNLSDVKPAWTTTVADIAALKKIGGLGWKSKILVGWALEREVVDGLVVVMEGGEEVHLTAMAMRDELFNRLVAMGSQMWEAR